MPLNRDPFPFPRYENDHTFTGSKVCQKQPFEKPIHLAQNDEPWSRLNDTATLASTRRSVFFRKEPETLVDNHGGEKGDASSHNCNGVVRVWINPQKASIYSIEGTIESHHNASTNRGYSRKDNGGFYST
ncbi:protein C1orf194 homolog isoform X2 [Electrophorus electricus]|uniref:protein C1orf194 homolog isoform X2 n=1 Tax=Electrophorus electricus TaxID=8005 RepID=UPI000F0A3AEE|nr:protein C1orf194 homolog isoform X2 [Electrophorus electricus]